jgi:L-lactate dehydrogenase
VACLGPNHDVGMNVGIVGAGAVGSACAAALVHSGVAREIVLVDQNERRAAAVGRDLRYGASLLADVDIRDGSFGDLVDCELVMITAGINEKAGGAIDRSDPQGRLRLLDVNAGVFEEIVPLVVKTAPNAVLMVVTDPPDPLADLARRIAGHGRVLSTGTLIDSLRVRVHIAQRLGVSPQSVEAMVVGEHGISEVMLWSSVRIAGVPVHDVCIDRAMDFASLRADVEHAVRYANISIIEGNGASQHGIGMVSARLSQAILRDERVVLPAASYQESYGVTLSLPSVVGRGGVLSVLEPRMAAIERRQFQTSVDRLQSAVKRLESRQVGLEEEHAA